DRGSGSILGDEVLVAVLLHKRGDTVQREVPGDLLELVAARRPVSRSFQPGGRMDHIEKRRAFRTERAAIHRMVRVTLDVDDVGSRVLGAVAQTVNEDAAGDRAIGASVAGLGRGRELERPDGSGERLAGRAKSDGAKR